MAIVFHEKTNIFHLTNKDVSYLIRIMENGQLENLYYGKALKDREDFSYMHEEGMRSQMSINVPEPGLLSMHYTRQEYPVYGTDGGIFFKSESDRRAVKRGTGICSGC